MMMHSKWGRTICVVLCLGMALFTLFEGVDLYLWHKRKERSVNAREAYEKYYVQREDEESDESKKQSHA